MGGSKAVGVAVLLLSVLLFCAAPSSVYGLPRRPWKNTIRHPPREKVPYGKPAAKTTEKIFNQTLDHFGGSDVRLWPQRYWLNSSSFDSNETKVNITRKPPVVFLCVGGEGPSFTSDIVRTGENHCGLMIAQASVHGALILALEHRFYGPPDAFPTPDLSTSSLRYLSAEQALMDMVAFRGFISRTLYLSDDTRWILFGGSYPGMLAAWGRSKFPHLFHAAISSSSPIQASADMPQYNEIVAQSLSRHDVGGSRTCLDMIKMAFGEWSEMMAGPNASPASRTTLANMVNICGGGSALEKPGGPMTASNAAAEVFEVQSNDPVCAEEACNIQKMCDVMMNNSVSPLFQLAALNRIVREGECIPSNYNEELVAPLLNTSIEGGLERVWFWQTCSEFGFFQTCNPGTNCPFVQDPNYNSLELYYGLCQLAFGINGSTTQAKVDETNLEFGGFAISATRILFVNGDIDPWHALSPLRPRPGMPAFVVKGASHHFWTHPAKASDAPAVVRARNRIAKAIKTWLDVQEDQVPANEAFVLNNQGSLVQR